MKKLNIVILFFYIFLNNCGYQKIYSKQSLDFTISEINKTNSSLNLQFIKALNAFTNEDALTKLKIEINSNSKKSILSKDSKGNPSKFELEVNLKINVMDNNSVKKTTLLKRKIDYDNQDDKFKLNQYELELEKLLINKLVEDTLKFISNI